jgi:ribose 5-phosphate isomerase A
MTDAGLENAAARALELIADGMRVGLGTGHAAGVFLARLADRVRGGLRVVGIPTSEATAALARSLRIPLGALDDEEEKLALTVDGADEVAPNLDLVKGFGGALVRERIIAAASRRQVILVGHDKLVDRLGKRGRIPIEVVPFACPLVLRRARELGLDPVMRLAEARPFISDNGNLAIDCRLATPLADARAARTLEAKLRAIPGVVDTGLFLGTAERVLVGYPDGRVDVLQGEG